MYMQNLKCFVANIYVFATKHFNFCISNSIMEQ